MDNINNVGIILIVSLLLNSFLIFRLANRDELIRAKDNDILQLNTKLNSKIKVTSDSKLHKSKKDGCFDNKYGKSIIVE